MGVVIGFDKPQEKGPSEKKLDELVELADNGVPLPEMQELLSILAQSRSTNLEIKDRRVELRIGDIITLANKTIFKAGYIPGYHTGSHNVIIQRKGCKKLIKLSFDDRIIIQSS